MKNIKKISVILALMLFIISLSSCFGAPANTPDAPRESIEITNGETLELTVGDTCQLTLDVPSDELIYVSFASSGSSASVSAGGLVTAKSEGEVTVTAVYSNKAILSDSIVIRVSEKSAEKDPDTDPYENMSATEFYESYEPAKSYIDAYYRSQHGFLSGSLTPPSKAPTVSSLRPTRDGMYIKNAEMRYEDNGKTYVVLDASGNEYMRIYKGGAYITLEEVAAYMYAFGGSSSNLPANYVAEKDDISPSSSIWGRYLRANHSYFSGDTEAFPYEPELPNIRGCGGSLQYYEMDIGTSGYNNGYKITRGTCRLVYGRNDLNRNGKWDEGELYVFYTYNHYNDFCEYLNYYNGWGETFGNITGGGKYNSKNDYNPTPYVPTYVGELAAETKTLYVYFDFKKFYEYAA